MSIPDSTPNAASSSAVAEAERFQAFRQWHADLRQLSSRALVTPILVGLNLLVFIAMAAYGVNPLNPTADKLLAWGANFGPATVEGEWWRLLTAAFLHAGIAHIGFNMYCLYGIGRVTERMIGSPGFLLTYLTSALAGSLASLAWNPAAVGVGASGAVFGIFGAFYAITFRAAGTIPKPVLQSVRASMGKLLAINLAVGFFVPNVDVAAHVGGLVWGFIAGLLLGHDLRPEAARGRMRRNMVAIILFVPVFVLGVAVADGRVGPVSGAAAALDRIGAEEGGC
jgi:rhomboid protease GluP